MSKKSNNDSDYIQVIAKIPNKDKYGNDITNDNIGVGGRHRADGTYSGMTYDHKPLDEDFDIKDYYRVKEQKNDIIKREEAISKKERAYEKAELLKTVLIILRDNPEIIQSIKSGVKIAFNFGKKYVKKAICWLLSEDQVENKGITIERTDTNMGLSNTYDSITLSDGTVLSAEIQSNEERAEMSVEEAQRLVIDILYDYISLKKKYDLLKNSNIQGHNNPFIEFDQMMQTLSDLIEARPELMDTNTSYKVISLIEDNFSDTERIRIKEKLKIE